MKSNDTINSDSDDMLPEYDFDYSKAKPNRFVTAEAGITVVLDADVAAVFKTSEAVNKALRAILSAIPRQFP
jgi:hypothetical protein